MGVGASARLAVVDTSSDIRDCVPLAFANGPSVLAAVLPLLAQFLGGDTGNEQGR
jgi:hypothetical protein